MIKTNAKLVGGWATPLKKMSSSIGMIRNPISMGKENSWQPVTTNQIISEPIFQILS